MDPQQGSGYLYYAVSGWSLPDLADKSCQLFHSMFRSANEIRDISYRRRSRCWHFDCYWTDEEYVANFDFNNPFLPISMNELPIFITNNRVCY